MQVCINKKLSENYINYILKTHITTQIFKLKKLFNILHRFKNGTKKIPL